MVRKRFEHKTILPLGFPEGTKPEQVQRKIHSAEGKLAEYISNFAGSMPFVYFHIIWFSAWIIVNSTTFFGLIEPFDPFPYGLLTMIVSLEAIFLATFIMINQNRQTLIDTYRELEEEIEDLEEEKEQEELEEEVEDIQSDLDEIKAAIATISNKIEKKAKKEVKKLSQMAQFNPEAGYIRNYLEWLIDLPWKKETKTKIDVKNAEKELNKDHYGLKDAKERIVEYLAVQKLTGKMKGPILCFVGATWSRKNINW